MTDTPSLPGEQMDEALAAALVTANPAAVVAFDVEALIREWNPAAARMFGYARVEILGTPIGDLLLSDDRRENVRNAVVQYVIDGNTEAFERGRTLPMRRADGSRVWVEASLRPLTSWGERPLFAAWVRELPEYNEATASLQQAESRREALLSNISDIITVMGPNGEWLSTTGAGNRILGWARNLSPDSGIYSLVHPDDISLAIQALGEVIDGTRTSDQPVDLRVMDNDGEYHILETVGENLLEDPFIRGVVLTSRDVTAARAARAELVETTSQLSVLLAALADGVLFLDAERRVVLTNQSFLAIFEIDGTAEELRGLTTPEVATPVRRAVRRCRRDPGTRRAAVPRDRTDARRARHAARRSGARARLDPGAARRRPARTPVGVPRRHRTGGARPSPCRHARRLDPRATARRGAAPHAARTHRDAQPVRGHHLPRVAHAARLDRQLRRTPPQRPRRRRVDRAADVRRRHRPQRPTAPPARQRSAAAPATRIRRAADRTHHRHGRLARPRRRQGAGTDGFQPAPAAPYPPRARPGVVRRLRPARPGAGQPALERRQVHARRRHRHDRRHVRWNELVDRRRATTATASRPTSRPGSSRTSTGPPATPGPPRAPASVWPSARPSSNSMAAPSRWRARRESARPSPSRCRSSRPRASDGDTSVEG